jgi:hypothetical protein
LFPRGVTTVRWEYRDLADNAPTAFCQFTVTINDDDPPIANCQPAFTVELNEFGTYQVLASEIDLNSYDNCEVASLAISRDGVNFGGTVTFTCADQGLTIPVTLRVRDLVPNTSTCVTNVTVRDNQVPDIECSPNITVLNDPGLCSAIVNYPAPTVTDNCPTTVIRTAGPAPGAAFPVGVTTVTFQATDAANNSETCSFTVTVLDEEQPVINCSPQPRIRNNDPGQCYYTAVGAELDATATDNCAGPLTLTHNYAPAGSINTLAGTQFPVGSTIVTWIVSDAAGNVSDICAIEIIVNDNQDPVITCPSGPGGGNTFTFDTDPGQCTFKATGGILDPTYNDNCPNPTLTHDFVMAPHLHTLNGAQFPVGTTIVTWIVTDAAGNADTCTIEVIVEDNQPPTAMCQTPFTAPLDEDGLFEVLTADVELGSFDNCGPLVRKEISRDGGLTFAGTQLFDCADVNAGPIDVILEVEDQYGNIGQCTTQVSVFDLSVPDIECPGNFTVLTDANACSAIVDYILTVTDNCIASVVVTQIDGTGLTSGSMFPVGTTVQTYQAVDDQGNNETCTFEVTVIEEEPPVINCGQLVRTRPADANQCSFLMPGVGFDPTFTDNCPGGTLTHNYTGAANPHTLAATTFPVGTHLVTWIATDASGNQSAICGITIVIEDTQNPVISSCGNATSTFNTNNGVCTWKVPNTSFDPTFTDNCPGATATHDFAMAPSNNTLNAAQFPLGTTTVTWTVKDAAGNSVTCTRTITVVDNELPKYVNCPTSMVMIGNDPDQCSGKMNWSIPVATDNCSLTSNVQTGGPVGGPLSGTQEVPPNASMASGTVLGSITPAGVLTLSVKFTGLTANATAAHIHTGAPGANGPVTIDLAPLGFPLGGTSGTFNTTINLNATDLASLYAGNLYVNIHNASFPGGEIRGQLNFGTGVVVPVGMPQTVTYKATDGSGNMQTCTFQIQVNDTQKPAFDFDIVMPADVTVECNAVPPFVLTTNDVHDNCTPSAQLKITYTESSTQCANNTQCCFYSYVLTRTWMVTDLAGNTTTHVQIITVQDTQKPTPNCQDATLTLDIFGNATLNLASVTQGTTDICAPYAALTITASQTNFTCADLGTKSVTITIKDPCGNTATCVIQVTVVEGTAPCTPQYDPAGSDPCVCLNNATTLTNGQFSERFQLHSLAGQTWNVSSSTGLYTMSSPNPPAAPIPLPNGTLFIAGNLDGLNNDGDAQTDEADEAQYYTLNAKHIEGIGFMATFTNNLGQSLTFMNTCWYPTPEFTNLPDQICLGTPPINLNVSDVFAGPNAYNQPVTFLINGNPLPNGILNPASLGLGNYLITAIPDAGAAKANRKVNGVVVPGDALTPQDARLDPGCQQPVSKYVQIVTTPTQVVCNSLVQVSLEQNCTAVVTQDMVLEGTYPCFDDYDVVISLPGGVPLSPPNVVTGAHAGLTLNYVLVHPISGNTCWGQILVEDKLPPVVTCPPDVQILCTVDPDSLVCWYPPAPAGIDFFGNPVTVPNTCRLYLGEPTIQDCSDYIWEYTDDYVQFSCAQNPNIVAIIERTFVVTDEWGNQTTCTQTITKLRGEASQVDPPADINFFCDSQPANFDPAITGWPKIAGHNLTTTGTGICGLGVTYADEIVNLCPGSFKIVRTWTIFDWCPAGGGAPNKTTFVQYIKVEDLPPSITIDCLESVDTFHVVYTIGQNATINGVNVIVSIGPNPPATFHIGDIIEQTATTYTVIEDIIIVKPSIKLKVKKYDTSKTSCNLSATEPGNLPHYACKTFGPVPFATVDAGCQGLKSLTVETPVGKTTNGGMIPAPGLPLGGPHNLIYRAEDECGNITEFILPVYVVDDVAPIAVCDEITDVNLSGDGLAVVNAITFDDGSWDGCCLDKLLVRKMSDPCGTGGTNFGPSVTFCCAEAGQTVQVVFRAVDCHGNTNDCMVQVMVNDKLPPILVNCPDNKRITCDWYAQNLETHLMNLGTNQNAQSQFLDQFFGAPTFQDNCSPNINRQYQLSIDQCLEGTITRTWRATDNNTPPNQSNQCTQRIFIDHISDWVVEFPQDITVFCQNDTVITPSFGEPKIFFETCELVAVSKDDKTFTVVPDACFKIIRTWTVINWCVVGANVDQEVVEASEAQFGFPLSNCDFDGDNDCDTRTFRDSWNRLTGNHPVTGQPYKQRPGASDAASSLPIYNPDTDPDSDPWDGYITYEQVIKVNDTGKPQFVNGCPQQNIDILDNTCLANIALNFPNIDDCVEDQYIKKNARIKIGNVWTNVIVNGVAQNLPPVAPGIYEVEYKAEDMCNNQSVCNSTLRVADKKKPTPYCEFGLVIELMNTTPPMVQVWASDFDKGSFDNCPGTLQFSFSSNTSYTGRTFDCDSVDVQIPIQMWVTDAAGNKDYCETFIVIQDNMTQCPDTLSVAVAGLIETEQSQGVADVNVQLSGSDQMSMMTGNDGMFSFDVTPGGDYTISPLKDDNPLNGVTTFDLVLITKHILGVQLLNSPYKIIAADANKSNSVTTFDLVQLRKLILFIDSDFPNNTSWRFVDKNYVFPDPTNPWSQPFPEVVSMNNVTSAQLSANFVAVKIGDVNGNAQPNFAAEPQDRNAVGTLVFDVNDTELKAGETHTVEFKARDFNVLGYQFTLNFDHKALEFVKVEPAVADLENFGLTLIDKGVVTTSWNRNDVALANGDVVFSLVFKAKENVTVSKALSLGSRYTAAEAYNRNGDLMDVSLAFNGAVAENLFELYQNTPNPFSRTTVIGFFLPETQTASLTITDINGKVVKVVKGEYAKGYNEIKLDRKELPTSGVLYYQLDTPTDSATKMMLLID